MNNVHPNADHNWFNVRELHKDEGPGHELILNGNAVMNISEG